MGFKKPKQNVTKLIKLKIYSITSWVSLDHFFERFLNQFDSLIAYFLKW